MAVTANQLTVAQAFGSRVGYPVLTAKRIYGGTMVFAVAASGFATDVIATTANPFIGIAAHEADNTSGASGDISVDCWTEGIFELDGTGFSQASVGDLVYAVDNYTLSLTSTDQPLVGRIVQYISSTRVAVKIDVQQS